jgi:tetratricopeptide (TPR) repeat protein
LVGAFAMLGFKGDRAGAEAALHAALIRFPLDSIPPRERPLPVLADLNARLGHGAEVGRLHAQWVAAWSGRSPSKDDLAYWAVILAAVSGNDTTLIRALRASALPYNCERCPLYELGRVFDRRGQADSAIAAWQRVEDLSFNDDPASEAVFGAPVLFRLGELYEGKGDRAKAMESYSRFVERWRTADPELQPQVTEAQRRLARFKAANG